MQHLASYQNPTQLVLLDPARLLNLHLSRAINGSHINDSAAMHCTVAPHQMLRPPVPTTAYAFHVCTKGCGSEARLGFKSTLRMNCASLLDTRLLVGPGMGARWKDQSWTEAAELLQALVAGDPRGCQWARRSAAEAEQVAHQAQSAFRCRIK